MDYIRQSKIFDPKKNAKPVTVIGCGGIGSFTAVALAKLGITDLSLWDDDKVESHNLPNQMFLMKNSVGQFKASQLKDLCLAFSDDISNVETYCEKFSPGCGTKLPGGGVVVCGVDSMEQRKIIWQEMKYNPRVDLFIDGRLGGQTIRVHAVTPMLRDSIESYEKTLCSDEETEKLGCTDRSIIDVGFAVAAIITRLARGHMVGEKAPSQVVLSMKDFGMLAFE